MLRVKDTKIFSEINTFFTDGQNPIFQVVQVFESMKIRIKTPGQSLYSRQYKLFHILMIFLLNLRNVNQYVKGYESWLECSKDVLYRFKNNSSINWRRILNQVNRYLIVKNSKNSDTIKCFIADDTDFEKRGMHMEGIGKIFSHVNHRFNLGFKSLHLNYWNGNSIFGLDHSMHIELGKNLNQGMKDEHLNRRFTKERSEKSPAKQRIDELTANKIVVLIRMIKRQIRNGIIGNYLLADSWFTCYDLIKSCLKLGVHYLGMGKIGKTKYLWNGKLLDAAELIQKNKHNRIKNRKLKMTCFTVSNLTLKDIPIKAFFFKSGAGNRYHLLITTNTKLNIVEAYELYKIRWTIEVFFKESKQVLGLGKSQSTCLDSHIAETSMSIIAYNILSAMKEKNEYQSIGGLFKEIDQIRLNPCLVKRFGELIEALIEILQEVLGVDIFEILEEKINHPDFEEKYLKTFLKLAA